MEEAPGATAPNGGHKMYVNPKAANPENSRKVTIFFSSMFGAWTKMEAKLHVAENRPFAQHASVPYLEYTPKRKRKRRAMYRSDRDVVVVDGWGHDFEPESMWEDAVQTGTPGVSVQHGRRSVCDPGWDTQFDKDLAASGLTPIFDGRKASP